MTWRWPRELDPLALRYLPARSVTADVHDNIAVAPVDRSVAPHTVTWYAGTGAVAYRTAEGPTAGDTNDIAAATGATQSEPKLFAAAQRDPSTPNPVVAIPQTLEPGEGPHILFRALLTNAVYALQITQQPHAGCLTRSPAREPIAEPFYVPTSRGSAFDLSSQLSVPRCAGAYRVAVLVYRNSHAYPPFGSATFTVR